MQRFWKVGLALLTLVVLLVWLAVIRHQGNMLQIVACDVGQGDAILIQQGNNQILVDAGPGSKVMNCLSQYISFWDREIELIVITHPQKDHYGGFLDVFRAYKIKNVLSSGLDASSSEYRVLQTLVGGSKTNILYTQSTPHIRLGLMYLDILHPSKQYLSANSTLVDDRRSSVVGLYETSKDPNEFSVTALFTYKDFNAIFTGDIDPLNSDRLAEVLSKRRESIEYLKVPHHGSKNGMTQKLLDAVNPIVAVISSGKGNSYGHPHKEVLDMLERSFSRILRTDQRGNVVVKSDGNKFWVK